jgi:hypothetical protein
MQAAIEANPLVFCSFAGANLEGEEEPPYDEAPSSEAVKAALESRLAEYNEGNPVMNLVGSFYNMYNIYLFISIKSTWN